MKDLNLIPKSLIIDKKNKVKKTYLSILIICIGFGAALSYIVPTIYEYNLIAGKQRLEKQVTDTSNFVDMEKEFGSLKKAIESRETEGKRLSQRQLDVLGIVNEIENASPEKLFIQKFDSNGDNGLNAKIGLVGIANDEDTLASFLRNLMDDDYFKEVVLTSLTKKQDSSGISFEITLSGINKSELITYNSWSNGFRIGYQPDWSKRTDKDNDVLFTANRRVTSADADSLEIAVTSTELTPKEFADERIKTLKEKLKGFKEVYSNKTKSSGEEAYKLIYFAEEKGTRYQYMELCTVNKSKGYIVTYKSDPTSFENKARTVDRILKSFIVIKSP
ncbi:MAG TPA: PilN domain-containing protein [Ruminiclostridium sp.]|nr:PilN domain-containing protein [Ruminiclostridium sp.]